MVKDKMAENNDKDITIILETLNQLRPYINSEGGDIEFIKYEDDYVFVKLYGACANCGYRDYTLQDNIYAALQKDIPTLKGVINLEL